MARSISATALDTNDLQRSSSTFSDWQSMSQETANEYALYSEPSMRTQPTLHSVPEAVCYTNNGMVEYSPDAYVSNLVEPASSPSLPLSIPQYPQQLHVQLTPHWNSSSESSTSPSTPSTAATQSSNAMSRQGSYNPDFLNNVSMLRLQSDSSCMLPILSEDGVFPSSFDCESQAISNDGYSFFDHLTGPAASETFLSHSANSVSASAQVLASSDNEQSYLAEDMRRSTSTSSSDASVSSTYFRYSRREREINAQAASRKIAPKAIELNDETESAPCNAQMARIRSEDGSSKTVGLLTKTPYVRPQHPKIMCQYCSERTEGFRGTHELDRHIARAHASRRKGYICIDYSSDKKFLASCKHCRGKKVYGAYYNAAAHLRRAHFHPRKRGRKGKNDEKRGGIGGGDHPAMDYLKQHWIKEVEVDNTPVSQSPVSQSPESTSDDAPEPVDNTYEPTFAVDTTSYPSSQQQVPQVPVDPGQYMGYGLSMPSDPMMYDDAAFMVAYDPNMVAAHDVNNFQFDAYVAP
jgi:hypothetical protein